MHFKLCAVPELKSLLLRLGFAVLNTYVGIQYCSKRIVTEHMKCCERAVLCLVAEKPTTTDTVSLGVLGWGISLAQKAALVLDCMH
jgi:hypothetical protein